MAPSVFQLPVAMAACHGVMSKAKKLPLITVATGQVYPHGKRLRSQNSSKCKLGLIMPMMLKLETLDLLICKSLRTLLMRLRWWWDMTQTPRVSSQHGGALLMLRTG
jgi:hypothetical protein